MRSRFTALESFGEEELERLKSSTAAVIGLGATGSVIAEHLARHGVNLVLVDRDYLEKSDLYSSSLYTREQVEQGLPKAEAARRRLEGFSDADIEAHVDSLSGDKTALLGPADIVMDGTDNLETRFLVDEYSHRESVPWVYTAAIVEKGYSMLFDQRCFSCVFEDVEAGSLGTCETEGVMREVSTIAASRSALKAVRYLAGKDVEEKLDVVPSGESLKVRSEGCEVCGEGEYRRLDETDDTVSVCGENKYELEREVGEEAFQRLRQQGKVVADNDYLTRVEIDGRGFALFRSGRAIVEARDRGHAEAVFDELVGR
ncbi:MAG: ThiF family adenylyltransferase [Candidatus Nanohaloarchaea archaeon]